MTSSTRFVLLFVLTVTSLFPAAMRAESSSPDGAIDSLPLFAIQVRVGPKWDPSRKPTEQALFKEHSANLKRLRDAGHLLIGARYSDIGLLILAAESEAAARAMIDADPSVAAGTFTYDIHAFNVFYSGSVRSPAVPRQ
jgi:uncharacterized protein YciI